MSIEAMKQALQALEFFCEYGAIDRPFERIAELKQAIAEAEKQEPVAFLRKGFAKWEPLYDAPVLAGAIEQAEKQEPVVWMKVWNDGAKNFYDYKPPMFDDNELEPLYTAPREWVGLTDEDIYQVIEENIPPQLNTLFDMAKWVGGVIEAKLKEKNT